MPIKVSDGGVFVVPLNDDIAAQDGTFLVNKGRGELTANIVLQPSVARDAWNVTRVGQVHFFYRARLTSDVFDPGHETQETRLFAEDEIPWDELAFRTVKETLQHYFADAKKGQFQLHQVDII